MADTYAEISITAIRRHFLPNNSRSFDSLKYASVRMTVSVGMREMEAIKDLCPALENLLR
jgi:hypothetical protein